MTNLYKPLRRGIVSNVPHGVNPKIIVTLYPNGVIGLREARRRREYTLGVGALYVSAVAAQARLDRIEKRRARRRGGA
jgi:hypothetical protein